MASKKYLVRTGFVVVLTLTKADQSGTYERTYDGGEELTLDDEQYQQHAHKLEFFHQRDRDAAILAERQADVAARVAASPAELISNLVAALAQVTSAAGVPAAPAAEPAPAA